MEPNEARSLIIRPSHELTVRQTPPDRILDEMVESALAGAREVTAVNVDLDALVREGKRIQRFDGTPEDILAFRLFYQAATAGHSEAQYLLSECYRWGDRGVERNPVQALSWFQKSAQSGFAEAQYERGLCYYPKRAPQNPAEAQRSWRIAYLLNCCGEAESISQDYYEAVKWFRKAAEQGHADAQNSLGSCYRYGQGASQDILQAYKWFVLAGNQGHEKAKEEAVALAAIMSPTELETAQRI